MNTSPSLNKELAPCPFCNGNAYLDKNEGYAWWQVVCTTCGSSGMEHGAEAEAIDAWNRRASTPSALHVEGAEPEEVSYEIWIGDECAAMATDATEASRYAAQYSSQDGNDKVEVFTVYSRKVSWEASPAIVGTPSKEGAGQVEADWAQAIVDLSAGWDDKGSTGPKSPMSWETVARTAMDYARAAVRSAPPASPSEGGGEPTPVWSRKMPLHPGCEHACQQAQDYGVWPESSCRPTCAYLAREPHPEDIEGNLAASRGEAVDAARLNWLETLAENGTIRIDDERGLCPRYIYWGGSTNSTLREAIDAFILAQSQGSQP